MCNLHQEPMTYAYLVEKCDYVLFLYNNNIFIDTQIKINRVHKDHNRV